jgi:hypothetical protein
MSTDLPGWTHAYSGKVRDLYIETGTADLASAQRDADGRERPG